jgi:hypothetical protein
MNVQYSHQLISSFYLWFDHMLLNKGAAYRNKTGFFYEYNSADIKLPSNSIYGSPNAQFVYDSSISGANIISGVFNSSQTFIGRGTSGLKIDNNNGRAIFNNGNGGLNISGAYALKDFNIYMKSRDEEFLFEEAFNVARERTVREITYVPPYKIIAPCAIIKYNVDEINDPFAFGGEDWTKSTIKTILISDNYFNLNGAMSAMKDRNNTCFVNVTDWDDMPLDYYGDLKTGYYNYNDLATKYTNDKIYVEKVFSSRIMEGATVQDNTFYVGYLEFDIGKPRFPRL